MATNIWSFSLCCKQFQIHIEYILALQFPAALHIHRVILYSSLYTLKPHMYLSHVRRASFVPCLRAWDRLNAQKPQHVT